MRIHSILEEPKLFSHIVFIDSSGHTYDSDFKRIGSFQETAKRLIHMTHWYYADEFLEEYSEQMKAAAGLDFEGKITHIKGNE